MKTPSSVSRWTEPPWWVRISVISDEATNYANHNATLAISAWASRQPAQARITVVSNIPADSSRLSSFFAMRDAFSSTIKIVYVLRPPAQHASDSCYMLDEDIKEL